MPSSTYTTGAQAIELEVDLDTGRIEILKGVAAFDVGKAINPDMVKAQMEGGLIQGISSALFECLQLKNGVVQNPSFVDYRIATSSDLPKSVQSIIVEVPQDDGPGGHAGSASTRWYPPSRRLRMPSMMPSGSASKVRPSRPKKYTSPCSMPGS